MEFGACLFGTFIPNVFTAMENYYPFGSVYLQNVKNALMNSGHAAPGWTYAVAEHHIYGSSRIGVHNTNKLIASRDNQNPIVYTSTNTEYTTFYRGKRHYELSNHLGNVQVVISDKRVSKCDNLLAVEYFEAEVLSAMDYYPGGMLLPGRQWYANADSGIYSFGMNGQLKDDELAGVGNSYTAEYWQYDSRLIRRWNVDPMHKSMADYSPYICFKNNPMLFVDKNGDSTSFYDSKGSLLLTLHDNLTNAVVIVSDENLSTFKGVIDKANNGEGIKNGNTNSGYAKHLRQYGTNYMVGSFESFYELNKPAHQGDDETPTQPNQTVYDEQGAYLIKKNNEVSVSSVTVDGDPGHTHWEKDPPEGYAGTLHTHPNAGTWTVQRIQTEEGIIYRRAYYHPGVEGISPQDWAGARYNWQVVVENEKIILYTKQTIGGTLKEVTITIDRSNKFKTTE